MDWQPQNTYRFMSAYGPWDTISDGMCCERKIPRKPLDPKERARRRNRKKMAAESRRRNRK